MCYCGCINEKLSGECKLGGYGCPFEEENNLDLDDTEIYDTKTGETIADLQK